MNRELLIYLVIYQMPVSKIFFIYHIYSSFTRKQIVLLCFGWYVRTRLGVAISEMSQPPVFHIKVGYSEYKLSHKVNWIADWAKYFFIKEVTIVPSSAFYPWRLLYHHHSSINMCLVSNIYKNFGSGAVAKWIVQLP